MKNLEEYQKFRKIPKIQKNTSTIGKIEVRLKKRRFSLHYSRKHSEKFPGKVRKILKLQKNSQNSEKEKIVEESGKILNIQKNTPVAFRKRLQKFKKILPKNLVPRGKITYSNYAFW